MKKCFKRALSAILTAAMVFSSMAFTPVTAMAESFATVGGWNESLYAEWQDSNPDSAAVKVGYKLSTDSNYTYLSGDDYTYLIRPASTGGYGRVDIPGLKAGRYDLEVTSSNGTVYTRTGIKVYSYDRSGYAHWNRSSSETAYAGVGAYNDDGTPKDNAIIIYVTDENKDTVTLPGYETFVGTMGNTNMAVGVGNIFNNNIDLMNTVTYTDNHPIIVRLVGTVNPPVNLTPPGVKDTLLGGGTDDNGYLAIMKWARNITFEGIGSDAVMNGWGITFSQTKTCPSYAGQSFEVRNLTLQNYPEDGVAFQGDGVNYLIQRCWVHNNIFKPGYCENDVSSDGDKGEGDGSCDFKRGQYYTMSYNHFIDCHKTNLLGSGGTDDQWYMTLHHNWYENVGSRQPLAANGNVHIYNTYFQGATSVTVDLRYSNASFLEANYYEGCKSYLNTRNNTVSVKSYNEIIDSESKIGSKTSGKVTTATSRTDAGIPDNGYNFPNGDAMTNFDTNPTHFYYDTANKKSDVTVLTPAEEVPTYVTTYAGTLHEFPVTESGEIQITVKSGSTPITGAAVKADGLTFTEGSNGVYTAVAELGTTYTVTVSKEGYSNVIVNTDALANDGDTYTATANMIVDTDGYATVKLEGGTAGAPVTGATVKLADGTVLTEQGSGIYKSAAQIAVGTYKATITNTGDYVAPTGQVDVVVKTTDEATVIMLDKYTGTVNVTVTPAEGETNTPDLTKATVTVGDTVLTYNNGTFTGAVEIGSPYTVNVKVPGWNTDSITPVTLTANKTSAVSAAAVISYKGDALIWNPTDGTNTLGMESVGSSFNLWSSASSNPQVFEDKTLTVAYKLETNTNLQFTADTDGVLTVVIYSTSSDTSVKIDGESYNIESTGATEIPVSAGTHNLTKDKTANIYYMQFTPGGSSVSPVEPSSETTTNAAETSSETTTSAVVVPPSGDGVINQSMTISRGTNDSYVTVFGDLNDSGGWKVAKSNANTITGYLKITLGKTADVTINNDGGKAIIMATELPSSAPEYSNAAATSVTMTNVPAGTYYIYNTAGNMTITEIIVTMDNTSVDTTKETTTETTTTTTETTTTTTETTTTTTETTTESTTESTTETPVDPTPVTGAKLTVGELTGKVGNEIIVPVMLTGVDTLASYDVNLTFDQALEVVNVTNGNMIANDDFQLSYNYNLAGSLGVTGANPTDEIVAGNDVLFYVTFKADTADTYAINLTVDEIYTAQDAKVTDPVITAGTITVEEETIVDPDPIKSTLPGDADGDGDVDKVDAAIVLKHVSGIAAITDPQYLINADCDGSAGITVADAVWILNYYKAQQEPTTETTTESTTEDTTVAGSSNDWDFSTNSLLSGFAYTSDTKSVSTGDGLTITGSSTSDKVITDSTGKNYLWYNAKGSDTARNLIITDCKAGDTITIYYGAKSDRTITVTNGTANGEFTKTNSSAVEMGETPVVVTVAADGDVVIYAGGQIGYYRIIRTSGSGEVSSETTEATTETTTTTTTETTTTTTETTTTTTTETTTTTTTETTTEAQGGGDEPVVGSVYTHNFGTDGTTSSFYTITGNLSSSKGTVTYNGLTISQCLKMETNTSIAFTAAKAGTLTLVFLETSNASAAKIDGTACASDANGVVTVDLAAGAHTITKGNTTNLYYMSFAEDGASTDTPTETTTTGGSDTPTETTTVDITGAINIAAGDAAALESALSNAAAGDVINLAAGNYTMSSSGVKLSKTATAANPITITCSDGYATLDFSTQSVSNSKYGLNVTGKYYNFSNLVVKNAGDNGMYITGGNINVENCVFQGNNDTGLQISKSGDNILIKNCTSFDNLDPGTKENADGFAAKLGAGRNVVFDGCISYCNSDDGWDLYSYADDATQQNKYPITIRNCIAFNNGKTTAGVGTGTGDMNGFKLGGEGVSTANVVENCIAFGNGACGFTDNNNPGLAVLMNCTGYKNAQIDVKKHNFSVYRATEDLKMTNCLSYVLNADTNGGMDRFQGTSSSVTYNANATVVNSVLGSGNKYYKVDNAVITNNTAAATYGTEITISDSDFVSMTLPYTDLSKVHEQMRNEDGSIKLNGFLQPKAGTAIEGLGAQFDN